MTRVLTSADFDSAIASGVTLVDMYAVWCGPCQAIAPIVEELSHEYEGKANITKLDVDASGDIAQRYGVMSIPTVVIFKDGQEVNREVGFKPVDAYRGILQSYL